MHRKETQKVSNIRGGASNTGRRGVLQRNADDLVLLIAVEAI